MSLKTITELTLAFGFEEGKGQLLGTSSLGEGSKRIDDTVATCFDISIKAKKMRNFSSSRVADDEESKAAMKGLFLHHPRPLWRSQLESIYKGRYAD